MRKMILALALVFAGVAHGAELFETLDYQQHNTVLSDDNGTAVKSHGSLTVRINKELLRQQRNQISANNNRKNKKIVEFKLPDGTVHELVITRFKDNAIGGYSAFGHIKGQPKNKVVINAVNDEAFAGTIIVDDISFKITPKSDGVSVVEQILGPEYQCGGGKHSTHDIESGVQQQIDEQMNAYNHDDVQTSATSQVDVMIIYTPAARNGAGGTNNMMALAQQSVDQMNLSLQNSRVNAFVNLVYSGEVSYSETGSGYTDLDWVTANSGVARLRDQYGADLVGMIIENPGNLCGLGWYMGTPSPNFASRGFQITRRSCIGGWTVAHEFGHNMGLQHDEANAGGTPGPYQYNYGHILSNNTHTIMAYGSSCNWCPAINHFSNPDVSYNGSPTGTAYHNNARRLNDTRKIVANFRQGDDDPTEPPPADTIELTKGKADNLATLSSGYTQQYIIKVPDNAKDLVITTSGGNGDVDLFVNFGSEASERNYDCASQTARTNAESCTFNSVQRGTYHIAVKAIAGSSNISVKADYSLEQGDNFEYEESRYIYSRYSAIFPQNNYGYYYAPAGTHSAELSVQASGEADFDLYLQRWNGYRWMTVAKSTSPTNSEAVNHQGNAGYYRWYVYSYSGNGTATLRYNIPK